MRVFLDANILFSAANPSSATRRLLEPVLHHAEVVTNSHAFEEAKRNLQIKRPEFLDGLKHLISRLELNPRFTLFRDLPIPEKDLPIVGGAVASKCTHLWTSDAQHFGSFYGHTIHGVKIVSSILLAKECKRLGWMEP